mmetsp:Transcript_73801/g.123291  ORF Transcript_73801/g.123291 Transcript_73801/m.123291 type:complete len:112 (+) Transcript_73801:33-368(+)|eukprot:CAMPEP_0119322732 /NCGR_PEP_ID=MMETSP1333-20130426/59025_1 /TAXON_ID=418940 /ORGANISM="Scyphosphaera apsteinii, Strain RCC1455" /LENGTH=111 /DNA_ID=CAMNT_0007330033 /DNA_START=24 /DNA_END=359 /DNA_ORIENTATION=-
MATQRHWARFLRRVEIEFCPFQAKGTTLGFLHDINTKKVKMSVPKLQVVTKRLGRPAGDEIARQCLKMTYVDGKEMTIDVSNLKLRDIYAEIEVQTGRLETEAMRSGKPWL